MAVYLMVNYISSNTRMENQKENYKLWSSKPLLPKFLSSWYAWFFCCCCCCYIRKSSKKRLSGYCWKKGYLLTLSFVLSFFLQVITNRGYNRANLVIIKHLLHYISEHLIQKDLLTHAEILSAAVSWTVLGSFPGNNGQNCQGQDKEDGVRYLL